MRVRLLFVANLLLAVVTPASFVAAQSINLHTRFTGTVTSSESSDSPNIVQPLAVTAAPTPNVITFNAAAVGIPAASAQTLTASFLVSGYTGTFTPTATVHYGHDYTLGTVKCVVSGATETCTVPITFLPTLPGARKDALLLMDGTTVLSTVLLGGTGQAPLGLIQPGVVTSPLSGTSYYIYQSVVDENGTVYFVSDNSNAVYSYTKAGVLTQLPITGLSSPHAIAIDGAGTLYIAQNTYSKDIITYSAAGVQGSIQVVPPSPYVPCANSNAGTLEYLYSVAVDQSGNLFTLELLCNEIFELKANGSYATVAINPVMTQPSQITVDAAGNLFIGGYAINELTATGVQTEINTVGAGDGLSADAADTLYATRYTGLGGVAELPASGYSTPLTNLDPTSSPLGMSTASDGTMYVGNYTALDKVDRSQGVIAFGEQTAGVASTAQDVSIYNGGNKPLTVSNFTIAGTGFVLGAAASNNCTAGLSLAPGAYCSVAVTMNAPHAGTFSGTVTFTSNSLNTASKAQTVALSGFVYGVYVVPSPASLAFAPQLAGTTSAPLAMKLTNQGDLYAAAIGTPVSSNPAFTVGLGTCTAAVAAGASCNLTVTFNPTAAQTYTGTVTVSYSSSGGGVAPPPATFSVSGSGAGTATLTPTSLSFASTAVGSTSATQVATLKNTGTVALTLPSGGITLTGVNPTSFVETTTCGTTLAPAATCTISVSFKPLLAGALTATLNLADSTVGSPQKITLSGTGTAANVTASLTPASLVFSATLLGSTSASQIATLKNTGSATLTIASGGITLTGTNATSFIETTTCGSTLAPAAACTITISFKPLSVGALTATLNVADNAAGSPQKIALSGTGIAIPTLTFTPASLTFPNTAVGLTSIAQTVVVKNAGTVAVTLSSVSLTGTHPTSFEQLNACGPTLAAGATCTVFVAFKPASAAVLKANLTLTDTAASSPQNVTLSGTGTVAPIVHLSATSLVFASTAVGATSPSQSVTITNAGTTAVNFSTITLTGTDAASFTQLSTCGPTLAAAASCIVNIALKPVKAGSLTAALAITDNGSASPQSIALTGTGH
jgi:hypothetical protein